MKPYKLKNKKNYQSFIDYYHTVIKEGKEAEAFLGTDAKYRIRQRDSIITDNTDIQVLMEYCLYPLYVAGDTDIARRTFEILKEFASSDDVKKVWQATEYLFIQDKILEQYKPLPFEINTDELVPLIIESVRYLPSGSKSNGYYSRIIGHIKSIPSFVRYDKKKVDEVVTEYREKYDNPPREVKSVAEVWPVVLDTTKIDAIGVVDGHLELLLIDENQWILSLEDEHLLKLQEKINNYIYYLESKQYVASYGDDFDKKFIHLTFQYHPSKNGLAFLDAVQKVLAPTDMSLKIEMPQ